MENEKIIALIIEKLEANYQEFDIKQYLIRRNVDVSNFKALFEKAKNQLEHDTRSKNTRQSLLLFGTFTLLTLLTIVLFYGYLPAEIESGDQVFLPLVGSLLISVFGLLAIVFYGNWANRSNETIITPTINYPLLFTIALFPSMVFFFILSSKFDSTAKELLKQNKVEVTGTIISGGGTDLTNLKGQTVNFSKLVVEFETVEGQKVIAYKDVSKYEFEKYYLGQDVKMIYSKSNPNNIDLLSFDSNVKELMGSEERALKVNDLFTLFGKKEAEITAALNAISYGWEFDFYKKMWSNSKRDVAVIVKGNTIKYLSTDFFTFPLQLQKLGFKDLQQKATAVSAKEHIVFEMGTKFYTNDTLNISVERLKTDNNGSDFVTLTTIMKIK